MNNRTPIIGFSLVLKFQTVEWPITKPCEIKRYTSEIFRHCTTFSILFMIRPNIRTPLIFLILLVKLCFSFNTDIFCQVFWNFSNSQKHPGISQTLPFLKFTHKLEYRLPFSMSSARKLLY